MVPRVPAPSFLRLLAAVVAMASACSAPEPGEPATGDADSTVQPAGNFRERTYERNFVFTTVNGDSALVVPWFTSARSRPGGVERTARAWLARGDEWEAFYDQRWTTPPTRVPARLLPHDNFGLLVGRDDAIVGILYHDGPRELELSLTDVLMEWVDNRGTSYRLVEAGLYLGDQQVQGLALDMSRVRNSAQPPAGDWVFLVSGDSLQLVLESPERADPGTPGAYRGWARLDFRDLRFDSLTVDWGELRAFQPARQDIPVAWTLTSVGGALEGILEVRTAEVQAGEGEGPVLPVDALFEVTGTITIERRAFPVRGLFRHTRE
jgi:hypothetical protein